MPLALTLAKVSPPATGTGMLLLYSMVPSPSVPV
jgi:hypothetical protein